VNGKIEIPDELPEGTSVIVLAPEDCEPRTLDPRLESLLESIEEELGRDTAGFVRRGFSTPYVTFDCSYLNGYLYQRVPLP
jgi:hypothetical protein